MSESLKKEIDKLKKEALALEKDPDQRCLIYMDLLELLKGIRVMERGDYKSHYFRTGKPLRN